MNDLEKQGLIKVFEYTYELSWKTLQDLLKEKGYNDIIGPRPVIEQSFKDGYISDGKNWMKMHQGRNLTSHTYDEETANEILEDIKNVYFHLLNELKIRLDIENKKIIQLISEVIKYGLLNYDLDKIITLISANIKVERIISFGSRAKGNFDKGSDVDLALIGKLVNNDVIEMLLAIEELYLPYKFDLVLYNRIKEKALIEHIDRVGIVLFSR